MAQMKDAIRSSKPKAAADNGHSGRLVLEQHGEKRWHFWAVAIIVLGAILTLTVYIHFQWQKTPAYENDFPDSILPPLLEAVRNFKLMFHGYHNGYLRSITGYIIFAVMFAFFLSTGWTITVFIFNFMGCRF